MTKDEYDVIIRLVLGVIAFVGVIAAPILTYIIARAKLGGELRLSDLEAIRGWSEISRQWDEERTSLHAIIDEEREKRRSLEDRVSELERKLRDCYGESVAQS